MALYCSREIMNAIEGLPFPATKDDLIDYAELKDAREAVVVALNGLDDSRIYRDISEVCENVWLSYSHELVSVLLRAPFPAKREDLLEFVDRQGASAAVRDAILVLPSGDTFSDPDEICSYVL